MHFIVYLLCKYEIQKSQIYTSLKCTFGEITYSKNQIEINYQTCNISQMNSSTKIHLK